MGLGAVFTVLALLALAVSAPAQAAPFHPRNASLDLTGLNHACGVAVDSKGDLYASSAGDSKVKVYNPSHVLLTEIADANTPCGLAVTTEGNLYVSEKATGDVVRFKPNAYPFSGTPTYGSREVIDSSGNAKGIAVDPFDNRLYVAEGNHVAIYKSDGTFEANAGEGSLTEASGVAAFTHNFASGTKTEHYLWVADAKGLSADRLYLFRSQDANALTPSRELTGAATPDGSFGFGSAGAYLAADPGNRNSSGECKVVGEQACTAGHLFLYDAAHKALDEFDASGEYLDRTANAAFADAEPTAIAIDRSGGASDGTLYVTAGAGASAKALAFGPLKAPSRKTLKKPSEETGGLSQELSKARAVATDSHGDVYAAAGNEIHVYDSSGKQITVISDTHKAWGLALDSIGNVYVLDKNEGFLNEDEVAYYAPSKYPPDSGTTYSREGPVTVSEDFPEGEGILKAIAVDPGPGPGKDHLFVAAVGITREYDSAANGSGVLDEEFAAGKVPTSGPHPAIAVDGARGIVYITVNPRQIFAVDEQTKEVVARFENTGLSKTRENPNPAIDQANGHVITFDGKTSTAREYDAAGSFVAAFGNFTENLTPDYRVAVDSACATHEPPLDETTTPTCKTYDPANGTVYVALDDTNPSHPPYDVTAFGPLKYGLGNEKFALGVEKTGTGSGKVTSSPAGIDCGATCSAEFEEGKVVTLKAEAASGSEFVKWGRACSGAGECKVAISEAKSVTAEYKSLAKAKFKLTVSKTGTGSGKVTSSPPGIDCGSTCSAEFDEGTEVTLTAEAAAGSKFTGWSGGGCSGTGTCKVTTSSAKEVTANFDLIPKFKLTVSKTGTGLGTVTSSPPGINCGSECSAEYYEGTKVELTQEAAKGSKFEGWGGACSGTGSCEVTMSAAKEVTASFKKLGPTNRRTLTLTKSPDPSTGTGTGSVSSKPKGIKCATGCTKAVGSFYKEASVLLTAAPAGESTFKEWTGACTGASLTCTVSMSEDKSVGAVFAGPSKAFSPAEALTVTKGESQINGGYGTVKASGLTCEAECAETTVLYQGPIVLPKAKPAKMVELSAIAAFGSKFTGWSGGGCSGTGTCKVTMNEATTVTANFTAVPNLALTVNKSKYSEGIGSVASKPKGISCAATCTTQSANMPEGSSILLTAKPSTENVFVEWINPGGDCNGSTSITCTVGMDKAETLTAKFTGKAKAIAEAKTLVLSKEGSGFGTVKASGLACEALCTTASSLYVGPVTLPKAKAGATVILKATSAPGSKAVEWGPGCKSNPTPSECVVEMSGDKSITAKFDELE